MADEPRADIDLMPLITSANVACGVHAGDNASMAETVALAVRYGVAVGAHPSLDDRAHFGRREMKISPTAVEALVRLQVTSLAEIALHQGVRLSHVKPHGALYNMAARDRHLADAISAGVAAVSTDLIIFGLAGSALIDAGTQAGLRTASEVFADRGYMADGSLAPRVTPGAVVTDAEAVADRAVRMVLDRCVIALDGTRVPVTPDTICIHGDTPGAALLAQRVRAALDAAGIRVSSFR